MNPLFWNNVVLADITFNFYLETGNGPLKELGHGLFVFEKTNMKYTRRKYAKIKVLCHIKS